MVVTLLTSLEPNDGLTVHGGKDGDGKTAFQACAEHGSRRRDRVGAGWRQKKQGRVLPPGPVHGRGDHPFLGMQPLMPEPSRLRLAASAAALPLKGPTITL